MDYFKIKFSYFIVFHNIQQILRLIIYYDHHIAEIKNI